VTDKKMIKCDRCKDERALYTSINNSRELLDVIIARGYDGREYVERQIDRMARDMDLIIAQKCTCRWVNQGPLPFGNTGVKLSAGCDSNAQKAAK